MVPQDIEFTKFLVIGNGRLAKHIKKYFSFLNVPYSSFSRSSKVPIEQCSKNCSHAILLISDSAIDEFITDNCEALQHRVLIHMSGSLVTPFAYSAHPLMTFTDKTFYDFEFYKNIPFIIEEDGPDLQTLLPGFTNPQFKIPVEKKALYHALCVSAGNFTTLLWQEAFKEFELKLKIPKEALSLYLMQISRNLLNHPENALTGPLQRGDMNTINKNLSSLSETQLQNIYKEFLKLKHIEHSSTEANP